MTLTQLRNHELDQVVARLHDDFPRNPLFTQEITRLARAGQ
jgi:hypothetical protein